MTVYQDVSIDLSDAVREALGDVDDTAALLNGLGFAVSEECYRGEPDDDFVAELVDRLDGNTMDKLSKFFDRLAAAGGKAS